MYRAESQKEMFLQNPAPWQDGFMKISRRELLYTGIGTALGWAAAKSGLSSKFLGSREAIPAYKVYALGMDGHRFPGGQVIQEQAESVLTELDLVTAKIKQTLLPMKNGHSVTPLQKGQLLLTPIQGKSLFIVNSDHSIEKIITTEDAMVFGGHGVHIPELSMFVVSVKAQDEKLPGYLAAYNDSTFELLKKIDIGAMYPHDIKALPENSQHIVVANGSLGQSFKGNHSQQDPLASVVDLSSGEIVRRMNHFELKGLNHVAVNRRGDIFTSQLTSLPATYKSLEKFEQDFPGQRWAWGDLTGKKMDRLPYPAPILYFPQVGEAKALMASPSDHLRHQDIVFHDFLDQIYSTYSESNTIVILDAKGRLEVLKARQFGIYKARGIRTFPDSQHALINDSENGMALLDMRSKKLVKYYDLSLFLTRHITLIPT